MTWFEFKDYLAQVTDLSEDALHIYAALLVQITVAIAIRRSLAHPVPWLCVVAVLAVNEGLDLAEPGKPIEEWQVLGGLQDVWNTLLLPTALLCLARFVPGLLTGITAAAPPGTHHVRGDEPEPQ